MRRSDWQENYDKERDRLNAKKEDLIDKHKEKQESIMNYRSKQASLMQLQRSNHLAQQNQPSLKQRFADFRRTMLFASMNAQDEIKKQESKLQKAAELKQQEFLDENINVE